MTLRSYDRFKSHSKKLSFKLEKMKTETLIKFYNDNEIKTVKEYQNTIINNIKETSKLVYKHRCKNRLRLFLSSQRYLLILYVCKT